MPDREPPRFNDDGTPVGRDPSIALPPELDPRGRRAARAAKRKRAASAPVPAPGLNDPKAGPASPAARRGRRRQGRSGDLRSGVTIGVKVLAALLSLSILTGSFYYWSTYRHFKASVPTAQKLPAVAAGQKDIDGKAQNILLLGNDSRSGATPAELAALGTTNDGGSANTDTMMVMHIPADGSKATVLSFPRDAYLAIPGHGKAKLNAAYPDGYNDAKASGESEVAAQGAAITLLAQTLDDLTGLHIDHYVQINLLGFYRISIAIGGVQVLLCQKQKEPLSGINLPAGWSTIQGTQALAFVRQRHDLANGDLDRIRRQQYFLTAVFQDLLSSGTLVNPFKIRRLLNAVSSSLLTDGVDLLSLANDFAEMSQGNLTFKTIPTDGAADNDAGAVLVVSPEEVQSYVEEQIGISNDTAFASASTVDPSSVSVDLLNESDQSGTATRAAAILGQAGFEVGAVRGDAAVSATTKIEYPAGKESQAKTLLAYVPGASAAKSSSVQQVTLVLGNDDLTVNSSASAAKSTAPATGSPATAAAKPTGPSSGVAPNTPNQAGCIS